MKQLFRWLLAYIISRAPRGILTDKRFFEMYQSRGIHITSVHFYNPIPDTRNISEGDFSELSELVGVDMRLPAQKAVLTRDSFKRHYSEFNEIVEKYKAESAIKVSFRDLDGAILYHLEGFSGWFR